jgi:hypothetical protein
MKLIHELVWPHRSYQFQSLEICDPVTDTRMAHHSDLDSDSDSDSDSFRHRFRLIHIHTQTQIQTHKQEGRRHLLAHNIPAIMHIYIILAYNMIDQSLVYSNVSDNK